MKHLLLLSLLFVGCSERGEFDLDNNSGIEVRIAGNSVVTKTSIGDDLATVHWSIGDEIAVWALGDDGFSLSAESFVLHYYGSSYSTANFSATLDESMAEGSYTYYGVYPYPESYSISDMEATIPLNSTQSGEYDGKNDIMVAEPLISSELSSSTLGAPSLCFSHLMHIFRIEIPSERNYFGRELTGLDVTFSQDVVGDVTVDLTDPATSTTLSSGSNKVSVEFNTPFETGDDNYIWLFVHPTILSGEVEFVAYGEGGSISEPITTTISKELKAGVISPMTLTLPAAKRVTTISVDISNDDVKSRIGESLSSVTFTAPSGVLFEGEYSTKTINMQEGVDTYNLYFYNLTDAEAALLRAGSLSATFETKSVKRSLSSMSLSNYVLDDAAWIGEFEVPYLFKSDFSEISSSGGGGIWEVLEYTDTTRDVSGLTGWVAGARVRWTSGSYITLSSYGYNMVLVTKTFQSRLNSCTTSSWGIKSDAEVILNVKCDAKWSKESGTMALTVGRSTSTTLSTTNIYNGEDTLLVDDVTCSVDVDIREVTSSDWIVWQTNASDDGSYNFNYVVLDNVTITIKELTQ